MTPACLPSALFAACGLVCVTLLHASEPVDLSARLGANNKGEMVLRLEVRNNSAETILFPTGNLAWNWNGAITLAIVRAAPSSEPLPLSRPIEDPPIGETTLAPGQAIAGEIILSRYFVGLENANRSEKLILFWFWELSPAGKGGIRKGGWIAMERTSETSQQGQLLGLGVEAKPTAPPKGKANDDQIEKK